MSAGQPIFAVACRAAAQGGRRGGKFHAGRRRAFRDHGSGSKGAAVPGQAGPRVGRRNAVRSVPVPRAAVPRARPPGHAAVGHRRRVRDQPVECEQVLRVRPSQDAARRGRPSRSDEQGPRAADRPNLPIPAHAATIRHVRGGRSAAANRPRLVLFAEASRRSPSIRRRQPARMTRPARRSILHFFYSCPELGNVFSVLLQQLEYGRE